MHAHPSLMLGESFSLAPSAAQRETRPVPARDQRLGRLAGHG